MKKLFIYLVLSIIILGVCQSNVNINQDKLETRGTQHINTLSDTEKQQGWQLLFDGLTLKGWKPFKGDGITGWKVVDGILYNSGIGSDHGGDIITVKQYENFELYLEWKITEGSNSGIFYHVQENVADAIYKSGIEYQLADDSGSSALNRDKDQFTGALYAMKAPVNAKVKPIGEWNTSRIIVEGAHVEHWLNGQKVVEDELWTDDWYVRKRRSKWKNEPYYGIANQGHIGLQDHGGLTMFRNIKIREL